MSFASKLKSKADSFTKARTATMGMPTLDDGTYIAECVPECGVANNGCPFVAFNFVILEGDSEGTELKGRNGRTYFLDVESQYFDQNLAGMFSSLKFTSPSRKDEIENCEMDDLEDIVKDIAREKPVVNIGIQNKTKNNGDKYLAIRIQGPANDTPQVNDSGATTTSEVDDYDMEPEVGDKVKFKPSDAPRALTCEVTSVDLENCTVELKSGKGKSFEDVAWVDFEFVEA